MSRNIKNPRAHRAAKELGALTGESLTDAVIIAVEERLMRLRREKDPARFERIMEIARRAAAHMKEPWKSIDHADLLYDERGLPK
jgi:antitoxin VapB